MDKFAIYSATQRIECWLRDEPEFFSKLTDPVASLLKDMKILLSLLGDEASTSTIPEESFEIRQLASHVEDEFDVFLYNFRSVENHVGLAKIGGSILNIHRADSLVLNIEAVRKRIQDLMIKLEKDRGKGNDVIDPGGSVILGGSDTDDEYVVGLEGDIQTMVQHLTTNEGDGQPYLFFITGCPGAGKTTLVRKLYKNTTLRQHFHRVLWFDRPQHRLRDLKVEILKRGTGRFSQDMDSETWVDDIGKCLIFLDDTTSSMTKTVADLLRAFPSGLQGSMIVITSSNKENLQFKENLRCHFHEMRGMDKKQGWDLFYHLAYPKQKLIACDKTDNTLLEMLGKEMLQKCEGQPEAITLLSGILRFKNYCTEEWEMVKRALTKATDHGVKGVYELSYADLPYYMKACFLYMVVFPGKYQIQAGIFRRMWIAEGFGPNYSEDVVMQCLEELSRRHLIQVVDRNHVGSIKVFQLQGGVYEFCITRAREENFIDVQPYDFGGSIHSRIVAFHSRWCVRRRDSCIRSLFQFEGTKDAMMRIDIVYKDLTLVRVLTLWGVLTSDNCLPDEIGNLVNLRYLSLRNTNIEVLPESTGNLKKLLTLDWREVNVDKFLGAHISVPNVIWKLEQLRYLYIPKGMPYMGRFKLHTLNNLHTLWGIRVGAWLVHDIQMWNFTEIQNLYLKDINSNGQLDAIIKSLSKLPNLRKLRLKWWSSFQDLESMEPIYEYCGQLSKLSLSGRIEETVALCFPRNLRVLILKSSEIIEQDIMLVIDKCCPNLKVLKLKMKAYLGTKMICKAFSFPELEELVVEYMNNLEDWTIEMGAFSRLRRLAIYHSKKLDRMPEGIRFITTLQELKLKGMLKKFCEKLVNVEGHSYLTSVCDKTKGEDFYIIQHIPHINFIKILYGED